MKGLMKQEGLSHDQMMQVTRESSDLDLHGVKIGLICGGFFVLNNCSLKMSVIVQGHSPRAKTFPPVTRIKHVLSLFLHKSDEIKKSLQNKINLQKKLFLMTFYVKMNA